MKVLLVALFMFVVGDFVINHGNGTRQTILFVHHFAQSVSQAWGESGFNQ